MPVSHSDRREGTRYLGTAEAANRMGVSQKSVRRMCNRGELEGAFQERESGPWHIPLDAVEAWIKASGVLADDHKEDKKPGPPTAWQRFRYKPWVFYLTVSFTVFSAIALLLAGLVSAGADIPGFTRWFQQLGVVRAFPRAVENEILIVIATFHRTEGVVDTDAHNEIRQAIEDAAEEHGFADLRVEVEPRQLGAGERRKAERMGARYDAGMVIWGADTGARITANFLNLKPPRSDTDDLLYAVVSSNATYVSIDETERTQMASPRAYATFITGDLPNPLAFLSFFALGQSYFFEDAYRDSTSTLERAIDSLLAETDPPEGLAGAYCLLGFGYLHRNYYDQAISSFDKAIALGQKLDDPSHTLARFGRAFARFSQGDLESAAFETEWTLRLCEYGIRIYHELAPSYEAIQEGARILRTLIYAEQGKPDEAISYLDRIVSTDPDSTWPFILRGRLHHGIGDTRAALVDYERYLELQPDSKNRELVEMFIAELKAEHSGP